MADLIEEYRQLKREEGRLDQQFQQITKRLEEQSEQVIARTDVVQTQTKKLESQREELRIQTRQLQKLEEEEEQTERKKTDVKVNRRNNKRKLDALQTSIDSILSSLQQPREKTPAPTIYDLETTSSSSPSPAGLGATGQLEAAASTTPSAENVLDQLQLASRGNKSPSPPPQNPQDSQLPPYVRLANVAKSLQVPYQAEKTDSLPSREASRPDGVRSISVEFPSINMRRNGKYVELRCRTGRCDSIWPGVNCALKEGDSKAAEFKGIDGFKTHIISSHRVAWRQSSGFQTDPLDRVLSFCRLKELNEAEVEAIIGRGRMGYEMQLLHLNSPPNKPPFELSAKRKRSQSPSKISPDHSSQNSATLSPDEDVDKGIKAVKSNSFASEQRSGAAKRRHTRFFRVPSKTPSIFDNSDDLF
ncbi:hypothetical protein BU16DRAFT_554256 [Lophium mytilinum]|uniref:Uncharacterized protein n=1 Tax=Lophium mytilinum TaxID=390894 RepID=A0A6A6REL7_9PEZI|nr:hypothetical protein BU16DRAFT_554256 [Lophium mytilinum]